MEAICSHFGVRSSAKVPACETNLGLLEILTKRIGITRFMSSYIPL